MKKNPDQFDELVKSRMEKDGGLWSDNVADLLRKEHRGVLSLIRDHLKHSRSKANQDYQNGYEDVARQILTVLKKRAT
ncbi:MAG: hypothetical protein ABL983_01705 [Nitrospira sp.]